MTMTASTSASLYTIVLVVAAAAAAAAGVVTGQTFDGQNIKFDNKPKICDTFACPDEGQVPVPKWPLKYESAGCGSIGGMQMFLPQSGDNAEDPNELCCDQRTACVQTCGSVKKVCDDEFFNCMRVRCKETSKFDTAKENACIQQSQMYQMMINMEQCEDSFDAHQKSNCDCVDADQAETKRLEFMTNFYNQYSPESVEKAAGLVQKADTSKKMANLISKLVKKYPSTIKRVKSKNQEMFDKVMKENEEFRKKKEQEEKLKETEQVNDDGDNSDENDGEPEEVQEL